MLRSTGQVDTRGDRADSPRAVAPAAGPMRSAVDRRKLEQLYDRYRDPQDENKIGIDGIQQFCDDLSLDPASVSVLVIAWKFRAATQCEFTKKEFVDGMTELGCDSTEKLRALLPRLEQELKDTAKFKDFYQFTFTFAKNPGQKGLDLEMAVAYWNLVLSGRFKFLDLWNSFLLVSVLLLLAVCAQCEGSAHCVAARVI